MAETKIVRAFSNASSNYEQHAIVQRACAHDLLEMLDKIHQPRNILEIGCGTGLLTRMVAERFPEASVLACDPSQKMLAEARKQCELGNVEFDCRWAHEPPNGSWDLIVSNAALQWAEDFDSAIDILKKRLSENSALAFTYFTRNTYPELAESLSEASGRTIELACARFLSPDEIEKTLSDHFSDIDTRLLVYRLTFPGIRALLEHIKLTGTRGNGASPALRWTKGLLEKTEREYLLRFGGIHASYEVMACIAKQARSI